VAAKKLFHFQQSIPLGGNDHLHYRAPCCYGEREPITGEVLKGRRIVKQIDLEQKATKRPYTKPELVTHGPVDSLTQCPPGLSGPLQE
jgi:hypothetical protein